MMNDKMNADETKLELLKLINRTGIRVVLPNDLENQIRILEMLISLLRKEVETNREEIARMPQSGSARLPVLKKIHAINKFRFFQ
jgi:hypothetical protein